MSIALGNELLKYDPVEDGRGGWPMKWGSGLTKPGGHYTEMTGYATGIMNRAWTYWRNCRKCDGNPSLPQWIWDSVKEFKKAPKPVIPFVVPITAGELALQQESARYMEEFWKTILLGDIILGTIGTGGALGGFGGAGATSGAGGLLPAFAH